MYTNRYTWANAANIQSVTDATTINFNTDFTLLRSHLGNFHTVTYTKTAFYILSISQRNIEFYFYVDFIQDIGRHGSTHEAYRPAHLLCQTNSTITVSQ